MLLDWNLLWHALSNALSNACKYGDKRYASSHYYTVYYCTTIPLYHYTTI